MSKVIKMLLVYAYNYILRIVLGTKALIKEFPIWLKRQVLKTWTRSVTVHNRSYLRTNMSGEDKSKGRHRKHQGRFHKGGGRQTGPLKIKGLKMRTRKATGVRNTSLGQEWAGMNFPDAKFRAWSGLKIKSEAKFWNVLNVRRKLRFIL